MWFENRCVKKEREDIFRKVKFVNQPTKKPHQNRSNLYQYYFVSMQQTMLPLYLITWLSLIQLTVGLTMDVGPGAIQCIYFDVVKNLNPTQIYGSFQVASGGFLDIDLVLKTPKGEIAYSAERKTQDRFKIDQQKVTSNTGEWSACFSNKMSTLTSKAVSFNFRVGAGFGDKDDLKNDIATKKEVIPIEQNILKLASELVDIREIQNYANTRERAHRDTTENTNDRVKWFSVCEFVVLIITNVWQIYTLRQFFEKRARV